MVQETKEERKNMGLRFRKSIKIAPGVKLNLNKNSTSVTVGTKGKHYTVNSKGTTTKTVGIPGTGLSYSTTSGSTKPKKTSKKTKESAVKKSNEKQSKPKKKNGCLTSCLVVFAALILIFAMVPSDDKKDEIKEPSKQRIAKEDTEPRPETVDDTNEGIPDINTEQAEQERIAAEQAEAEQIAQEQAEAERIAAEQAAADAAATQPQNLENNFNTYNNLEQQQTASSYVLNTSTMKFHHPTCRDVKKIAPQNYSTYDGSRDDVIGQGYSPCGHCSP